MIYNQFNKIIVGCIGASDNDDGSYRLDFVNSSRLATTAEILAATKAQRIEQINILRSQQEQSGFSYLGKRIDSDPLSCQRIQVAATAAQLALAASVPDFSIEWSCTDNSILSLDAVGVLGMLQALATHGLHVHYFARGLKAQIAAAENPESIDIVGGWPE